MKLTFKQMEDLIVSGKDIDAKRADFDINKLESDTQGQCHDSMMFDNWIYTTTQYALLHKAIISGNKQAVKNLLENGADKNILYTVTNGREQTDNQTREKTVWPPTVTKTTILELAKDKSEILAILKPQSPTRTQGTTFNSGSSSSSSSSSASSTASSNSSSHSSPSASAS